MKKEKIIWIVLPVLLAFSYILLFTKLFSLKETKCTLQVIKDTYTKENIIVIRYKDGDVKEVKKEERFSSSIPSLLDIKKAELEKEKYKVHQNKKKVRGSKIEKVETSYQETLGILLDTGYTCK